MEKVKGKELQLFCILCVILLFGAAICCDSPGGLAQGMWQIILSRNALITDYFVIGGYGAGFLNAAIVLAICIALVMIEKIPFTGPTLAALFINAGYSLWGKNPVNILPILFGVYLYAKLHRLRLGRFIYTALFGTCLAPFVTELVYILPFGTGINLVLATGMGILIGFLLPPLSTHTASMHMGYNLFNVGFSAGVLAFVLMCVLRSLGIDSEPVLIWQEGTPLGITVGMYVFFGGVSLFGWFMEKKKLAGLFHLFKHPGRAVADFVLMDGVGATMMNMGLVGMVCMTYILLIGGDFSGPVLGAVWMAFGFAAFGAHVKNYLPVLAGVYVFTFISKYQPDTPGIQLAAMFGVGLAPIAGQFGVIPGMVAGMLHSTIVMCTSTMYGGLNLYNNGFSAGWVAIFMVPALESFMKHYENRPGRNRLVFFHRKEVGNDTRRKEDSKNH